MKLTGLKREQVRIHNHLLGGGFGRRLEFDGTVRAVQIAQHVRGPGAGDLDARGRHPARHVSPVLLRPPQRGCRRAGQGGGLVAPHHRLLDRCALLHPPGSRTASIPTQSRARRTSRTRSRDIHVDWVAAGAAARNSDVLVARRRRHARHLRRRELRRRARGQREAGPARLPPRVARQEPAREDRSADGGGTIRMGQTAAGRARPRDRALHRLRQLHRAGRPGQRRQGRRSQADARVVRRRLRHSSQSGHHSRADGERYRLRPVGRAISARSPSRTGASSRPTSATTGCCASTKRRGSTWTS